MSLRHHATTPRRAPCAAAALALLVAGCVYPATAVRVEIDTDIPPDRPLLVRVTALRLVAVAHADAGWAAELPFPARDAGAGRFPASLTIAPAADDPRDLRVRVVLEAEAPPGPRGEPALRFRVRSQTFAFVPRVTTRLPVFLSLACGLPALGCRAVPAAQCTVAALCDERGLVCDRGRCVPDALAPVAPDAGAATVAPCARREECAPGLVCRERRCVACTAAAECAAGDACVAGVCRPCACPAPGPCEARVECAADGSGRCVPVPAPNGTPCDDGAACTHSDACVAGACRGTPVTCVSDACAARACNGTARCTVTPLGRPVYETFASGFEYRYAGAGAPAFYTAAEDRVLYLLVSSAIADKMLSAQPDEASSCDWCGCASACGYRSAGPAIRVASAPQPGMVPLRRCVRPTPIQHRSAPGTPAPPHDADCAVQGYVCAP